ncbi:MAG: YraN family protein [Thermodesulfobacteriota bacterium]
MTQARLRLGAGGEDLACRLLASRGYRIVCRNWRGRTGELDIVAEEQGCTVFVEVKTRRDASHGHPAEAITPAKQRQLARVATEYLVRTGGLDRPARFDVVAIFLDRPEPEVEIIANAFDLP